MLHESDLRRALICAETNHCKCCGGRANGRERYEVPPDPHHIRPPRSPLLLWLVSATTPPLSDDRYARRAATGATTPWPTRAVLLHEDGAA